jgi:hypothetical protein
MDFETKISEKVNQIPQPELASLSRRTIFFGHQSVGRNIMEGLGRLAEDFPKVQLKIKDSSGVIDSPYFLHAPIGRNTDPGSKIEAFSTLMHSGLGGKADIAFFKFCYVDITTKTDVEKLFDKYKMTMNDLSKAYPTTCLMHTTVPLTIVQTGPCAWIKKIIGRSPGGYEDNIQRNRFNQLMRSAYQGKAPLFDLALVEATRPDGTVNTFAHNGKNYQALDPEYASDGRHLNANGARWVATEMVAVLVSSLSGKRID